MSSQDELKLDSDGITLLPDGSAFCTASMPLPKDHWIYKAHEAPPAPFHIGLGEDAAIAMVRHGTADVVCVSRQAAAQIVSDCARYAIQCATTSGKEMDFDPDALVQNMIVAMLGYWTADGRTDTEV